MYLLRPTFVHRRPPNTRIGGQPSTAPTQSNARRPDACLGVDSEDFSKDVTTHPRHRSECGQRGCHRPAGRPGQVNDNRVEARIQCTSSGRRNSIHSSAFSSRVRTER